MPGDDEDVLSRNGADGQTNVPVTLRRSQILLLGGGLLFIAVIVLLVGFSIQQGKAAARKNVNITLANLASTLVHNIENEIRQMDLGSLTILDEVARQQKTGQWDGPAITAAIAREDSRHPDSIGYRVFGADGKLRYGLSNIVHRDVDISQRSDFVQLRETPSAAMLITPPLVGQVADGWLIELAHRITGPDGSFGGAVYTGIPVRRLAQMFAALDLGPGGSVALYHTNLQLAARFPEMMVGTATISDQLRAIVASGAEAVAFDNLSPVDGIRRTGYAQKINGLPYYISIALADDDYLTEWRRSKANLILFSVVSIAALLLVKLVLYRTLLNLRHSVEAVIASERKLRTSDANLRSMMDNSPYRTWMKDTQGRYLAINKVYANSLGLKDEEEAVGKTDLDLNPRELAEKYRADDIEVMASRRQKHIEELAFGGNRTFWIETFKTPVIDAEGSLLGTVGFSSDITERKNTEMELRIAATAFDAQDGIVITDANERILRVNQAFANSTGYRAEELVGQTPRLIKSGLHDPTFYAEMWRSLRETGSWQGEIWDRRKNGEVFPKWLSIRAVTGEDGRATHYVASQTDITERKMSEDRIKHLAFNDPLTHLPNRRLLIDRLQHGIAASLRNRRGGALLFIDLDHFKTLNDTLGHDQGDLLLQETAKRLTNCVREADTVARLGGDEFLVVLEDLSENAEEAAATAETVAKKILFALGQPYVISDREHHSSASIGVTLFGDGRSDMAEIMKQADIAMYQAKESGRNAIRFFDPDLQVAILTRATLAEELRKGVEAGQFFLEYQPQVENGRVIGAEALIRWRHPGRGTVLPGEFIGLAEETDLIRPLGRWVLESACAQIAAWADGGKTAELTVAVNVSSRQLRQNDFVEEVLSILERTKADPNKLKLELTESMLAENVNETVAKMNALKAHGVKFSLDDFGTGYSSLSYLKRLPLEQLKIDRSFVMDVLTDPNDAAIAHTIVALGRTLGLKVIAEGVETEAQLDFLIEHGCHAYQGFLFSRPVSVREFEGLLN